MSYTHSTVSEPEFEQAKSEIFNTLAPLFKKRPELENAFKGASSSLCRLARAPHADDLCSPRHPRAHHPVPRHLGGRQGA